MDINADLLINIAVQLPLLVLFVIYNERKENLFAKERESNAKERAEMLARFDTSQTKRDAEFLKAIAEVAEAIQKHDDHVDERIQAARDTVVPRARH